MEKLKTRNLYISLRSTIFFLKKSSSSDVVSKSYDFSKVESCHATLSGTTKQYWHGVVTRFYTVKTLSNVTDVVAPMHVAQQSYFDQKCPICKFVLSAVIIKIFNKKLKIERKKNPRGPSRHPT